MQEYLIPAGYGEIEYIEKRSRFIGRVWHTESEEEALTHIRAMREQHWDATHNVYAYSIKEGGITRFSDDGEPSGTSGMPTLNVFKSANIQDFCCVVTRYFGGILLGAGGLVRAYTKSASMALEAAGKAQMKRLYQVSVICTYPQYERVKFELPRFDAAVDDTVFGADVELCLSMSPESSEKFLARLGEISAGSAIAEVTGETLRPVKIE
jgi:uncharacterized YigZ family protein